MVTTLLMHVALGLLVQVVIGFAFYRMAVRNLPDRINDLILKGHIENDLTKVAHDTADLVRTRILELEEERIEALVGFARLKGRRLGVTESNQRRAYKKSLETLSRQIELTHAELYRIYGSDVLLVLEWFERIKLVRAVNGYLDKRNRSA